MKVSPKKAAAAVACALLIGAGTFAVVNAQQKQADFDPSQYKNYLTGDDGVSYDTTMFGGGNQQPDGLELDRTQQDDYNLTDGTENIRDDEKVKQDDFQLSVGGGTGGGDADNSSPIVGIGSGGSGNIQGSGSGTGDSGGTGGEGGTGDSGGTGGSSDDGIDYGVDYNTPEKVESSYPTQSQDEAKNITASGISVSGSLMMHFYPGECPRPSEMLQYITVSAKMSDGSNRDKLQYCQFAEYGGDYTVTWGGDRTGVADDCVGKAPGKYTATVIYRGQKQEVQYDIVTWQLSLPDFDEDPTIPGYERIDQTASPTNSPIVDLSGAMKVMYETMEGRQDDGYIHKNVIIATIPDGGGGTDIPDDPFGDIIIPDDPWGGDIDEPTVPDYYIAYFGGWKEKDGTAPAGTSYKMERPKDEDINYDEAGNGVYNIDMEPVWAETGLKPDGSEDGYYVALQRDDSGLETIWETILIGYKDEVFLDDDESNDENSYVLNVPDGVMAIDMDTLYLNGKEFGYNLSGLKSINLSKSVSKFTTSSNQDTGYPLLAEISAAAENQNFLSIDGVLYNKTGKELVCFPEAKQSVEKWSNRVERVGNAAFKNATIETLVLPKTIFTFGEKAFFNASLKSLEITTEEQMKWESALFGNEKGLTTEKLIISGSAELPELVSATEAECYDFCERMEAFFGAYDGMSIVVPDSESDITYLSYLSVLQENLAFVDDNTGFSVLNTPSGAKNKYEVGTDGCVYTDEGKTLALVPKATEGSFEVSETANVVSGNAFLMCGGIDTLVIPENVQKIESGAFGSLTGLKTLIFKGETAPVIENGVFGESVPEGLVICAGSEENNYGPQLQEILLNSDAVAYYDNAGGFIEDGSIFAPNGSETYKLVLWNKDASYANLDGKVTAVAKNAFDGCGKLIAVNFPASLEKLGDSLFTDCTSLKSISFNGSDAPEVNGNPFDGVSSGAVYFVPNGKTAEYASAVGGSSAVKDAADDYDIITVQDKSVALYGNIAADDEETDFAVVKYISGGSPMFCLDDSTTRIYAGAFENATAVRGLQGEAVTKIDADAFKGCTQRNFKVSLSAIPECGTGAFGNCVLGYVELGSDWDYIDALDTTALEQFDTANTLVLHTEIGELTGSFAEWANLTDFSADADAVIILGDNLFKDSAVETFAFAQIPQCGANTFTNCEIYSIELGASGGMFGGAWLGDVDTDDIAVFSGAQILTFSGDIGILSGSFAEWENLAEIHTGNFMFGGTIDVLGNESGDGLFEGCTALEVVDISSDVTTVEQRTFAGCTSLYDAYISSVGTLGEKAFADCSALESVTFGGVGTVGQYAFENCSMLDGHSIALGDVDTLCSYAFKNCGFDNILLQDAIGKVEGYAFDGCSNLEYLTLWNVAEIDDFAFANCENLFEVELSNVKTVGNDIFENDLYIFSVDVYGEILEEIDVGLPWPEYIYDDVTIAENAFRGCEDAMFINVNEDSYVFPEPEMLMAEEPKKETGSEDDPAGKEEETEGGGDDIPPEGEGSPDGDGEENSPASFPGDSEE